MHIEPNTFSKASVVDAALRDIANEPPFFAVSLKKLIVMSVCTFGLYEFYWFYRNWHSIKSRERSSITPVLRAIFAIFFVYACFARVRRYDAARNGRSALPAGPLAIGWIVFGLSWKLYDPLEWLTFLMVLFLLPVQSLANRLNAQAVPTHDRNARLHGFNWVGVVLGGTFLLLAILGTLVAPPKP